MVREETPTRKRGEGSRYRTRGRGSNGFAGAQMGSARVQPGFKRVRPLFKPSPLGFTRGVDPGSPWVRANWKLCVQSRVKVVFVRIGGF